MGCQIAFYKQEKDMKRKLPLNKENYLPEYFSDTVARSFEKESEQRILYWDFRKALDEKIKMQIEILLNEIVKSIKNKAEKMCIRDRVYGF